MKTSRLEIRLNPDQKVELQSIASELGTTVTALLTDSIDDIILKYKKVISDTKPSDSGSDD